MALRRALALALAAPLLLAGIVLQGTALLLHAHGEEGAHLHVLVQHGDEHESTAGDPHALDLLAEHEHHDAQHHQGIPSAGEHHESRCFVLPHLGPLTAPASVRLACPLAAASLPARAVEPAPRVSAGPLRSAAGVPLRHGVTKHRSGAAAVLRTSRALLI